MNRSMPSFPEPLTYVGAGMTHAGLVRAANEDAILTNPSGTIWAVSDGMGGHEHGAMAAYIVIENLAQLPDDWASLTFLDDLLRKANAEFREMARALGAGVLGATVVALLSDRGIAHVTWLGDSRAYLCRNGSMRHLTRDHTMLKDLIANGLVDPKTGGLNESAHVITRAVGAEDRLELDYYSVPVIPGDRVLLCSDELTLCLDDDKINEILATSLDPDAACRNLLRETLDRGTPDSVSTIVVFAEEA